MASIIVNRGRLPWILLSRKTRLTDSRNDTTATAKSKDGYTMAVSFWMEPPPHLSLFSIHCTKPPHVPSQDLDFSVVPHVVGADGPFVLLGATFYAARKREYFLYRAGSSPSLELIPSLSELDDLREVREWGVLGHGGDGHCLLVALRDDADAGDGYQLLIYSSKTESWSTRTLHNPCPGVDRVIPDKVITLGQEGGLLGWVDLSHGLLVCDLLLLLLQPQDPGPAAGAPVSCFIPLPEPLPGNRYKFKYPFALTQKMKKHPSGEEESRSASWFRDLACVNGVLKFVEMESHPAPCPQNKEQNIIYDADLIMSLKREPVEKYSCLQLSSFRDAWRAVTWTRKLVWPPPSSSSSNFWRQSCAAHVADVKKDAALLAFRELYSAFPVLSPEDGEDITYLKSLEEPCGMEGWVAALDIGNKVLKAVGEYYLPDDFYHDRPYDAEQPFRASTLSRHLDITPGMEVSACRKIPEASSSADHPSNTSIRIGELSCSKPRSKIQRQSESAEENIQNYHISQVHPVENYLQQKWGAPPAYPLRLHENYQQPQQCFNKPNGPCGPWYASLTPADGGHNYQPPWPPSKHQLTSSTVFKPQEGGCRAPKFHFISEAEYIMNYKSWKLRQGDR